MCVQALRDDVAHNTRYRFEGSSLIVGHDLKYASDDYNVMVYLMDFERLEELPLPPLDSHTKPPVADLVLLDVVDSLIWCVRARPVRGDVRSVGIGPSNGPRVGVALLVPVWVRFRS